MESDKNIESGVDNREVAVANKRSIRGWDFALRLLALILALAAAVVLGVDKETKTVSVTLVPTLPPFQIPVTAKMKHLSAFVYFVVANSLACAYAAITLLLTLANMASKKTLTTTIIIFDLIMVSLLFSSIGAALSIGLMGYEGNSHVNWKKVCNVFDKFCNQGAVAFGLSGGAAFGFFLLLVLATVNMHKKC